MKLSLVTGPPLVLVLIMMMVLVTPRFADASATVDNQHRVEASRHVVEVIDTLEEEAGLSLWLFSGGGEQVQRDLTGARAATDEAVTAVTSYLDGESELPVSEVATALNAVSNLGKVRADVDASGRQELYEAYFADVNALVVFVGDEGERAQDPQLIRFGHTLNYLILAKDKVARVRAAALPGLAQNTLDLTDYREIAELDALAFEHLREYMESTDGEHRGALEALLAGEEATRAKEAVDTVLTAARAGSPPTITAREWWDVMSAELEVLTEFEDQNFDEFVQAAKNQASAARNEAVTYLLIGLINLGGAIVGAFLLGRAMVRGLASVANQAEQIATTRLPEVLESLRNPTPEALAQALPQVEATTTDEVGTMANAFNAVLRISVETAIEHAQRRAKTVTNMLVNLGRRNQALIERQLALMDELESRQEDPAVLEKLFRLDQLITRTRRNAENLVVLAGQKQARNWSEAVPLGDVLRAAAAEVSNMARVKVDLGAVDHIDLAGPHAVDVSHLLAELIENGLSSSAPSTQVLLRTERSRDDLKVWITDSGVGMEPTELAEANERLADPPDIDSMAIDRVGFQVVGRLARQVGGVTVTLSNNPGGGLAACVTMPLSLFEGAASRPAAPAAPAAPAVAARSEAVTATSSAAPSTAKSSAGEPAGSAGSAGPSGASSRSTGNGIPPATALEQRLVERRAAPRHESSSASGNGQAVNGTATSGPAGNGAGAKPVDAGVAPVDAAAGDQPAAKAVTSSGLVKRRPGKAFGGNEKAAAADAGVFRRLPVPGEGTNSEQVQLRRFQMISQLQSAVVDAREEDDDDMGGK
ncbi:MAG: nitrate- and nitrite sensing domain-containing protein [Acidimicrobiales bacterium]